MKHIDRLTASILVGRVLYSSYWFYTAPALPMLREELGIRSELLGTLPMALFLGSGIAQIPMGIVASRIGNAKLAGAGLLIMSTAGLLTALAQNLPQLIALRFITGIGSAMYFATGASILASLHRTRVGLVMGIYNALFSVGAGLGMLCGLLYQVLGWRMGIALLSSLGIPISIMVLANRLIDNGGGIATTRTSSRIGKEIILAGTCTGGFWGAYHAAGNLLPTYAVDRGEGLAMASAASSILLLSSMLGSLAARVHDIVAHRAKLTMFALVTGSLLYFPIPLVTGWGLALFTFLLGFIHGLALTLLHAALASGREPTLSLATVNSLNMLVGMWLSLAFSMSMTLSPELPWFLMGILSLALLAPLIILLSRGSFLN